MLPDASTDHGPDTLARKLSRCKEGMAHFLPSGYKFYLALRVSRYKFNRSQKSVTVQYLDCVHVSVSGFKMLNEFIWPAEQRMMIND